MALDLSDVVNDSDMGDCFCILRSTGQYAAGGWTAQPPISIQAFGVIAIAEPDDLLQIPEADRVQGSLQVMTATPIYQTLASKSGTSDQIEWRGGTYRVQSVAPWKVNGFYSAIAVRMKGD
jgi:hypothetical protein